MKIALITGITGQDGSYLSRLLLSKDYFVYGLVRRSSSMCNRKHIDGLSGVELIYGDMTDEGSIDRAIKQAKPDEIYNLAAQSHVGISFKNPEYTTNVNALGVVRLLEAVRRNCPKCKVYQASTSEMFGKSTLFCNEDTPFTVNSPYAASKLLAHNICDIYRKSYDMFICCGILFNHESIPKNYPVIIKNKNNFIDIVQIEDMFKTDKHKYEGILEKYKGIDIWNGEEWTKIISGSCYRDKNKKMNLVQSRKSCYEATLDHIVFDENNEEVKTHELKIGNKLFNSNYCSSYVILDSDKELCKFIGFLVADGSIDDRGRIRLVNTNKEILCDMSFIMYRKFGWDFKLTNYGKGSFEGSTKDRWYSDIQNDTNFGLWLKKIVYTKKSKYKKIPKFILNSDSECMENFVEGYYYGDGRRAGNESYKYKGFTTNSAVLCLGLNHIFNILGQESRCKCEYRKGKRYYRVNLKTPTNTNKGNHLKKNPNEIIRICSTKSEDGWFYDLQTESQTFAVGPNLIKIHNSPNRGDNFVTQKIVKGLIKMKNMESMELELGNLDARRDWGYAGDYVKAMWKMMQFKIPQDYVVATGSTYSIKDFIKETCNLLGLELRKNKRIEEHKQLSNHKYWIYYKVYDKDSFIGDIYQNTKFMRPNDVEYLQGDAFKAEIILGWEPEYEFKELIKLMIDSELKNDAERT